ncbi:serine hydroxymethyltransferase [[Clostridium] ultunense Esp]|uniref:2-methylserine hydroxymethyltransferase n=1 Tax=[Clostridium] ultunense Esp TaxID=1288971 RepID=M1Z5Y2_9FIRM|nr:serine hydroxymethyltransferase [Schnuerera ultunensis]CCQ93154.1 serine hydroxymethyltransferase [[Clostridium] ultunense Esp]SHD76420.1 serine hydroxymethyltransferase [[Clostridium] ultunense Esp]
MLETLKKSDPILSKIVEEELERQRSGIEMIASESYVPTEVLELQGSILTNKTTEGFPGKRYHAGCHVIDKMENLGIERAKALYGASHANIQAHSGSQSNQTVYAAILEPNDTVLGLRLDQGGHLTHGNKVNFSGKIYNFIPYGLNRETELIDYDEIEKIAKEHNPKLIVAGGSAYPRSIDFKRIAEIAKSVDAYFLVDMAHVAGLVAAKLYPNPMEYADFVTSTTTKTLCGARGGFILCKEEYAKQIDKAMFPGSQGSPHLHIMAAKAYTFRRAATEEFKQLMTQVIKNAQKLGEVLSDYGFRIVSGGTDTHLLLVDLRPRKLTGRQLEEALDYVGITVNKNMIPFDPEKPMVTSGIRIGTTAMTIRGMKEKDMEEIGEIINKVASNIENKIALDGIREEVLKISKNFPLYEGYF